MRSVFLIKQYWETLTRSYPWHFIGFLILAMLIPSLYDLSVVWRIGRISMEALAITEQYEFIWNLTDVVNAVVPFGILALIAQNYHDKKKVIGILKAGLIIQFVISIIVTGAVVVFIDDVILTIGTPVEIVSMTSEYLLLKTIAIPFEAIAFILLIAIKSLQKGKEALILVTLSVMISMILDMLLISNLPFSLHLGIHGVAIGYVVSKVLLMVIAAAYVIHLLDLNPGLIFRTAWRDHIPPLFVIGGWSGLDTLIHNVGYSMLLLALNTMGKFEFAGFGLAIWLIYTLRIPVPAIGQATSVLVGNFYGEKRYVDLLNVVKTSILLALIIMLGIAGIGVCLWQNLSLFINPNPDIVTYSVATFWWLIIPYICYSVSTIVRSIFYGTGQTRYLFYIACIINIGMLVPFVILIRTGIITADFSSVMMFYMFTFLLDMILSLVWARHVIAQFPAKKDDTQVPG